MSTKTRRWLCTTLIALALVVIIASTKVVDTPGPMTPSKPEFTFEFSTPFVILSGVFATAGLASLASIFRAKREGVV
jgi:hypothetical protein